MVEAGAQDPAARSPEGAAAQFGALGLPEGTIVLWMLALMTVATLATAVYRTVWIARRLGSRSSA